MALRAASYPRDDPVSANDGTAGAVDGSRGAGRFLCTLVGRFAPSFEPGLD
jgi:hypothetical protein